MLTLQEIKRSGYDGLLPAGMVLTGGTSALPGIRQLASQVLGIACPHGRTGKAGRAGGPVEKPGLFHQCRPAALGGRPDRRRHAASPRRSTPVQKRENPVNLDPVKDWFKRLLP